MKTKKKPIFKSLNNKLGVLVAVMLVLFFVIQIYATSLIGTKSSEIEQIRIQRDQLRLENEILNSKIDNLKSVANIEEIAKKFNLNPKTVTQLQNSNIARE